MIFKLYYDSNMVLDILGLQFIFPRRNRGWVFKKICLTSWGEAKAGYFKFTVYFPESKARMGISNLQFTFPMRKPKLENFTFGLTPRGEAEAGLLNV